jgi:hypothetical protein
MNGMIRFAVDPPQDIGSEKTVTVGLGSIINSPAPGNNYHVAITTRDAANNVIDGPMDSILFVIKDNSDINITTYGKQDQR